MEFTKNRFAPWICVIVFIGILYFIFIEEENRLLFPNAIDFESLRGNTFPQDFKEALAREDVRQEISTIFEKSTDKLKRDLILSLGSVLKGKVSLWTKYAPFIFALLFLEELRREST